MGIAQNIDLFEHLWKHQKMFYSKYKPFMKEVLINDSPIPFNMIKDFQSLKTVSRNRFTDSIYRIGLDSFIAYFFNPGFRKFSVSSPAELYELPSIYQVASLLFDEGILVYRIEEYWHLMNKHGCR
jgi:hypothetical protein